MRFSSTFIIALACIHTLYGQIDVAKYVLSSGGSEAKSGKLSVSGTLGETFIFGGNNSNYFYCQGFHSGNEATITAVFETDIQHFNLHFYPNPTHDYLQLKWKEQGIVSHFLLHDEKGSFIKELIVPEQVTSFTMDLRELNSGKYILQFRDQNLQPHFAGWILFTR